LNGECLPVPLQIAGRDIDIPSGESCGNLIQADLAAGESQRVEIYPDRVLLRAEHQHLGHAIDHGDAGGDYGVGEFVNL